MNLKIRQYRESRGLTQKEFAKAIKKSVGTIQSWEREDSYPNADMLWRLCEFFGTDPNEFMGWYDEHPRDEANPLSRDESVLVDRFRECAPGGRATVLATALGQVALAKEQEGDGRSFDDLMAQVKAGGDMPTSEEVRAAIVHDARAAMGGYETSPVERQLNSCAEEGAA